MQTADRYGGFNNCLGPLQAPIDRTLVTPFLLRVFVLHNCAPQPHHFEKDADLPKQMHVYTWADASLRELTALIQQVDDEAKQAGAALDFFLAHPATTDDNAEMQLINLGATGAQSGGQPPRDGSKADLIFSERRKISDPVARFEIGDYLVVNVIAPGQ